MTLVKQYLTTTQTKVSLNYQSKGYSSLRLVSLLKPLVPADVVSSDTSVFFGNNVCSFCY